ncbi:MAG: PLDc N-terminal domain-containing protein, partial [Microbacterium sp.]
MPTDPLFIAFLAVGIIAAAVLLAGMALAIAQALRDNELPPLIRWGCAIAVIAFPLFGAIAWFAWT